MSRGRHDNQVCVVTDAAGTGHGHRPPPTAVQILTAVVRRSSAELSATETLREELDRGEDGQPAVFVLAQPVDQRPAVHRHRVDVGSEVMVLLRRWQSALRVEGMRLFEVTARGRLLDLDGCLRNPHRDGPR